MNKDLFKVFKLEEKSEPENTTIKMAGIIRESIVDGPGIRYVIFSQGCPHGCKGCHNPSSHSLEGGYEAEVFSIIEDIEKNPYIKAVTFSGGEPTVQPKAFLNIAKVLREKGYHIMMYSGYTFEQLVERSQKDRDLAELLTYIDLLVDGRYEEDERDLTLRFRGSRNQNIVDVKKSLEEEEKVLESQYM